MTANVDVIVVGGGPTGLTLAAELGRAGLTCRVLEKREGRAALSRAFTVEPRTMELLDMRGWLDGMLARGRRCPDPPLGDRDGRVDYGLLDTPHPFSLTIPQHVTESCLQSAAEAEGAVVHTGTTVTALRQDEDGVDVDVTDRDGVADTLRAAYLVGADGVTSFVRSHVGVDFDGQNYDESVIMSDARLASPPAGGAVGRITRLGMVALFPFADDTWRIIVFDHRKMSLPADLPVSLEDIRESCSTILGHDVAPYDPVWLSRFRSSQRHARRYRVGRVLLAGDAAHTHIPSGGQGLQTGIQDAFNLGWKLAAAVRHGDRDGLLDSYEGERYPVAAETLRKTDMSFRFETSNGWPARLLRAVLMKAMRLRAVQRTNLEHLAGLALRYPGTGWVGRRVPDRRCTDGSRLHEHFRAGRFVALTPAPVAGLPAAVVPAVVAPGALPRGCPPMLLVRPDGYVAWAGTSASALREAAGRRPVTATRTVATA